MKQLSTLPVEVRDRLGLDDAQLRNAHLATRAGAHVAELRYQAAMNFEYRENDDGTVHLTGYATTWDTWYDVAGGAPYGWSESIAAGAAKKALKERDDVRFYYNHEGAVLARSASNTLMLEADDTGLLVDVPSLDVRGNMHAAALHSMIQRGDVDQMSFAFAATRQKWNDDYTERRVLELRLFDVSAVDFPANPATIIAARSAYASRGDAPPAMPLSLALALADLTLSDFTG